MGSAHSAFYDWKTDEDLTVHDRRLSTTAVYGDDEPRPTVWQKAYTLAQSHDRKMLEKVCSQQTTNATDASGASRSTYASAVAGTSRSIRTFVASRAPPFRSGPEEAASQRAVNFPTTSSSRLSSTQRPAISGIGHPLRNSGGTPDVPDHGVRFREYRVSQSKGPPRTDKRSRDAKSDTTTKSDLSEDSKFCIICMDNTVNTVLVPCGHMKYCIRCASKLRECAYCRQNIACRQKVFA